MTITPEIIDRAAGCFMGLAIGDALGAPLEFSSRLSRSFVPVTGYRSGGPFNLEAGQWTDDTSQAICLAEAILYFAQHKSFHNFQLDFLDRMYKWYSTGYASCTGECFDIGNGTEMVLSRYGETRSLVSNPSGAGNGCIMRLAAVPMVFHSDPEMLRKMSVLSCTATHGHIEAVGCTVFLGRILASFIAKGPDLSVIKTPYQETQFWDSLSEDDSLYYNPSGRAVTTLTAALYSLRTTCSFEDCVLKAVNLCGDSDSVGAVAGQLAGAYYGLRAIPQELLIGLCDYGKLLDMAHDLCGLMA